MFNQDVAKVIQNLDFTSPLTSTGSDMTIEYGDKNLTLGNLNLKDFSYNKTPINSLNLDLSVSDEEVDFSNITANLNVTNNPVRKEFGGSTENTIRANQVVMNLKSDLVKVDSLKGTFWPGSVVSLFLPSVAETLDEFRFRAPPSSNTSGTIDLADKSTRTSLSTTLSSGAFKYNFIDEDIPGFSFSAAIKTTSEYCQLTNIKSELFGARAYKEPSNGSTVYPLSGKFTVYYNKEVPSFNGILAMNKLQISSIADTYDFEDLNEGTFSTLFHFEGDTSGAKKLNTTKETTFKIENANLVDIPLLGPFSKITKALGKTANNNRLGYSKISTANGAYTIKNGELNINNLRAASSSLELAGKGKYNIDTERVDMKFEVKGFNKGISFLEIIKPFIKNFPVIQGVMKYKAYGQLDDLKIRPDL